ncbi:MAG: hypothetical protein QNJ29_09615 [Rhizobiaceae bacterium]|nr:hypothetical protein [Rhizobiaceae bacterium]
MHDYIIPDSFVSLAAVFGLLILSYTLRESGSNIDLNKRFQFAIRCVAAMLLSRVLWWTTDVAFFDGVTILAAGLIPLAILILCEGLLQRHASKGLKLFTSGGAALFFMLAFFPSSLADPARMIVLLVFQSAVFIAIGYLVIYRDKTSLSIVENKTIERLGLSLLLILPFTASDFRTEYFEMPVRLSGIAILFMCWLAMSLRRNNLTHMEIVRSFVLLVASALAASLAISWLAALDAFAFVQVAAIVVSATMLASIYNEGKTAQRDTQRDTLLHYLANQEAKNATEFLIGFQKHPLVAGALILKGDDLSDFDADFLACFDDKPIRKSAELSVSNPSKQDEQLAWFFEKYNASHIMLASRAPMIVVALNLPTMASSPGAEVELLAVQRMAYLLSQSEAKA